MRNGCCRYDPESVSRFYRLCAALAAFAAMVVVWTMGAGGAAHAESLGPYTHGETRSGDEDILFCVAGGHDVAIELAHLHNAWVLSGRDPDSGDYAAFQALSAKSVADRQCFRADRLDHRSVMTLHVADKTPEGDPLYSVVAGVYAYKGNWLTGYMITFEQVPPKE